MIWATETRQDSPHCWTRNFVEGLLEIPENKHGRLLLFLAFLLKLTGTEDYVHGSPGWPETALGLRKNIFCNYEQEFWQNPCVGLTRNTEEGDSLVVTTDRPITLRKYGDNCGIPKVIWQCLSFSELEYETK